MLRKPRQLSIFGTRVRFSGTGASLRRLTRLNWVVPPMTGAASGGSYAFQELAQNGARRETVPDPFGDAHRALCAFPKLGKFANLVDMPAKFARIEAADPETAQPPIQAVLEAQSKNWGAPLLNHLLYARRPSIFRGVRAMWSGLDASGLIDGQLQALLNRRIAALNGCAF